MAFEFQVRKVIETVPSEDPSKPPKTTVRRQFLVGKAAEPVRLVHAMMLISPLGLAWANAAAGGAAITGVPATVAGLWLGSAAVALEGQAREAIERDRQRRAGAGEPEQGLADKAAVTLREFSALARRKSKATAMGLGVVFIAGPVILAQWATRKLPRVNAFLNRADPLFYRLADGSTEADFELDLARGQKHCERLFWVRLGELEEGECKKPSDQLERLWRASELTGASVEPDDTVKGSVLKRIGELIALKGQELEKKNTEFKEEHLFKLFRLCAVSAEAIELEGVVGKCVSANPQAQPKPPARPRL